jgi:hypothetical protein
MNSCFFHTFYEAFGCQDAYRSSTAESRLADVTALQMPDRDTRCNVIVSGVVESRNGEVWNAVIARAL